jgi:hypothetical protein
MNQRVANAIQAGAFDEAARIARTENQSKENPFTEPSMQDLYERYKRKQRMRQRSPLMRGARD